nr:tautomerase family protein [uncultured Butyrivibrio sp.]
MPHVEIKCFEGRTDKQKTECAERITQVIAETLGCKTSSVSVAIKDIPEKDWKTEVWDKSIVPDEKYLYKRPGYSYDGEM